MKTAEVAPLYKGAGNAPRFRSPLVLLLVFLLILTLISISLFTIQSRRGDTLKKIPVESSALDPENKRKSKPVGDSDMQKGNIISPDMEVVQAGILSLNLPEDKIHHIEIRSCPA